jgi:hypothetical protein
VEEEHRNTTEGASRYDCEQCRQPFKSAQGLAGHRRLAHSASTGRELDDRSRGLEERQRALEARAVEIARTEAAAKRREAENARRKREIEQTGPSSIGLTQCKDCDAWFEDSNALADHSESVHSLALVVAKESGVSRGRVDEVWTEACRKSKRHPRETPEEIVKRFWGEKDREILEKLRERGAVFEEG